MNRDQMNFVWLAFGITMIMVQSAAVYLELRVIREIATNFSPLEIVIVEKGS
jgi:hypothetical protein